MMKMQPKTVADQAAGIDASGAIRDCAGNPHVRHMMIGPNPAAQGGRAFFGPRLSVAVEGRFAAAMT